MPTLTASFPRASVAVRNEGLSVMAKVASIASSGAGPHERATEILDGLKGFLALDAVMLSTVDLTTGARQVVASEGYEDRVSTHLTGGEFHEEFIAPFAVPQEGWPVREADLPVDPLSLRSVAEFFRPAGLRDGMTSALFSRDGRYVGFLDVSSMDRQHLSEEACAVVGHLAGAMANVIDPLESARRLTATLDDGSVALGLLSDGQTISLHGGAQDGLLENEPGIRRAVARLLDVRSTAAFLWPSASSDWYGCRAFRCRDGIDVLTVSTATCAPYALTRREIEVLSLLVEGRSNADIAELLCVAMRTVKAHVEHIFEKLSVATRAAAVGCAVREGILLPPRD
jgi:DNA-binding CsgD family transcriptional regulator